MPHLATQARCLTGFHIRGNPKIPTQNARPLSRPQGEPAASRSVHKGSGWAYRHFSSCTWVSCPKMRGLGQVSGKVPERRKSPGPQNSSFVSLVGKSPLSMEGRPGCRPVRAGRACAPASLPEATLQCPPSPPGRGHRRGWMGPGPGPHGPLSAVCPPLWSGPASSAPAPSSHPLPELHSGRLLSVATLGADQPRPGRA